MDDKLTAFKQLLQTMNTLREECPWDRKQTFESLRPHTVEEVYELSDAVLKKDDQKIMEELGDLLLHVVFYARIGEEKDSFDIKSICDFLVEKLIKRHPHIYGDTKVNDEHDVKDNWEKIKAANGLKSALGGVPLSLPSMIKAIRIQEKARGVGFDWDNKGQVWDKVQEELEEFNNAVTEPDCCMESIEDEFGDVLFSLINYARFFDINPDTALEKTNLKFMDRFNRMETKIKAEGKAFREMSLVEMEEYWQQSK